MKAPKKMIQKTITVEEGTICAMKISEMPMLGRKLPAFFRYDVSCPISLPDIHFHFVFLAMEYRSRKQSNAGYTWKTVLH